MAMVDEHTGLCGLTTDRNSLVCSLIPPMRKDSVLHLYACRVCCGQSLVWAESSVARESWEELCCWLPCLDCFDRPA